MTRPLPDFQAAAWSWVHHLRAGGSTPWDTWSAGEVPSAAPPAYGVPLPGAAQLELLRRLAERAEHSVGSGTAADFAALADTVMAVSGPGRGLPELPLPGAPVEGSSGPRPVPMDELPPAELVRVASGVLVSLLLRHDGVPAVRDHGTKQPWRRAVKITGAPQTVDSLRGQLRQRAYDDAGPLEAAVVVVLPVDVMAAEVWAHRVLRGAEVKWGRFWAKWHSDDQLPVYADPASLAEKWVDRLGADRVFVVVAPSSARAAQLLDQVLEVDLEPQDVGHLDLGAACVEVVRNVNTALGVATDEEGRNEARRTLRRLLAVETRTQGHRPSGADVVPAPPAQLRGWLQDMARESQARLAESGCVIVGDLEDHGPREALGLPEGPDEHAVLEAAVTGCLAVARGLHGRESA
ncbi:hypothetical protein KLP28_06410 [Nocardioidaceae bacterium]|nr:hypothetical protein KLP28_06410 [Nocardioidaceae bacterium]